MADNSIHTLEKNPRAELDYTVDKFINGLITVKQPKHGFRAGCDSIFLAASIQPEPETRVLDVGAGVGVISLALAKRCPDVKIVALENHPDLVSFALSNMQDNHISTQMEIYSQSLHLLTPSLTCGLFDYIVTNPPYHERNNSTSANHLRSISKTEDMLLEDWIKCCYGMLKSNGLLSMIHRPARLTEIVQAFEGKFGDVTIFPLWEMNNETTMRVIIQARKDSNGPDRLCYGMHTNDKEGLLTGNAYRILHLGKSLKI